MSTTKPPSKIFQYVQVADQLRRQIEKGILKPGDRLPSMREMRQHYGVNFTTTEKAHALLEEEKLIVRSNRSGVYVADPSRKQATGFIGFCGVSFTQTDFSAYWTRVIEGVETTAQSFDAEMVLLKDDSAFGWDKVDGVLANGLYVNIPALLLPPALPLVSLFIPPKIAGTAAERMRVAANTTTLAFDDYAGMRSATEYLLSLGHRRIAYLHNDNDKTDFYAPRLQGYADALHDAGITVNPHWLRILPLPTSRIHYMHAGREGMRLWLREDWQELGCTALLAHNDDAAWGAVDVLREAGIDVPGQVSVIGFDGTETAECCSPELTTVEVPLRLMGQTAVELLQRKIKGETCEAHVVLPTELRVRASTAPCV